MTMKIYDTLEILEQKIEQLIQKLEGELVKSITVYPFLSKYLLQYF